MILRAGTQVFFEVKVRDASVVGTPLYTPSGGVKLTLYRPDATIALNKVSMSAASTGVFTHLHQTVGGDQVGIWEAEYEAEDAGSIGKTFKAPVFELRAS